MRRAWKDTRSWYHSLCRLPELEVLALRTESSLVSQDVRRKQQELGIVLAWVGAKPNAPPAHIHPMLSYIRVWYRTGGNGIITHWSRASGAWSNIVSQINPPNDAVF